MTKKEVGGANIVNLPFGITTLSSESTSAQIIAALGGKDSINAFVGKIMAGNAVVIMAGGDDSAASSYASVVTSIQDYIDSDNFSLTIVFTSGTAGNEITITAQNGVYRFSSDNPQALLRSSIVSDPSVGGTDKPASAEAVKIVNDNIETIRSKIPIGGDVMSLEPSAWNRIATCKRNVFSSCLLSIGCYFARTPNSGITFSFMATYNDANIAIINRVGTDTGVSKIRYVYDKTTLVSPAYIDLFVTSPTICISASLSTNITFRELNDWEYVPIGIPDGYVSKEFDL